MGGEPLALQNLKITFGTIAKVKEILPDTKIYVWTGYRFDELKEETQDYLKNKSQIDFLIDGPYIESQRDITLNMRGSTNQRIIDLKTGKDVTDNFE